MEEDQHANGDSAAEAGPAQPGILAVGHNQRNLDLLSHFLGQGGYRVTTACDAEEFGRALDTSAGIALALVDLAGFDRGVWDLCERVRNKDISLLIISPRQSAEVERTSLAHGAYGVLVKPLLVKELMALIRQLVEE